MTNDVSSVGTQVARPGTPGRNEPCPCGSGKKYKRCCGLKSAANQEVSLPPGTSDQSSQPGAQAAGIPGNGGMDPFSGLNPALMSQMMGAFQRLPKGQLQKMQALMQKAMRGKDISRESKEFERSLPKDFQEMFRSLASAQEAMQQANLGAQAAEVEEKNAVAAAAAQMTEDQARELVQKAAEQGKIAKTEAAKLLGDAAPASGSGEPAQPAVQNQDSQSLPKSESKVKKLWNQLAGKK